MGTKLARNVGRAYIGVLIALVIALIIGGLWYLGKDKQEATTNELAVVIQTTLETADTDEDGLKDWEEALWKTDPKNTDTDGDGTTDGEEVRLSRDPIKPGPKDQIEKPALEESPKVAAKMPETTLDTIAQQFLKNYDTLRNPSVPETIKSGIGGVLVEDIEKQTQIKQYSVADIHIAKSPAIESELRSYGQAVGTILLTNRYFDQIDEPTLLRNLLQTKSAADLKKVTDRAAVYKKISDELLALTVPQNESAISIHLAILNAHYGMYQAVDGMSGALSDPLAAMISLQRGSYYQNQIVSIYNTMIEVKNRS